MYNTAVYCFREVNDILHIFLSRDPVGGRQGYSDCLLTQVRDTALALQNEAPTSNANRESYVQNVEGKVCRVFQPKQSAINHSLSLR